MRSKYSMNLNIALTALFAAIVFVLSLVGGMIKIGAFSITIVLIPIIIGGIYIGPAAGALLGFIFGLTVFLTDADAAYLMTVNRFYTFVGCVVRATLAGWIPALFYRLIYKKAKNPFAASIVASVTGPIVNTGLFALCLVTMFGGLYEADASAAGQSVVLYVLLGMLTVNFLIEFISTVVLCPAISVPLLKLKERMEK